MAGNAVTLSGNLTRDPEVKFLNDGTCVTTLGLAVNRRWQGRDGEWQEEAHFFDVVAWRDLAENLECLQAGDRVIVEGRLQFRSWENDEGEKRSKVEVVADEIGASLRWATVDITKTEKRDDRGGSDRGGNDRGGRSSSRRSSGSGSGSRGKSEGRRAPRSLDDYSEEPF